MLNILFSILLLTGPQDHPGTIRGTILNAKTKDPVSGVTISITQLKRETKSDSDGEFVFKNVPPGTYGFEVTTPDFFTMHFKGFIVRPDSTLTLNIPLAKPTTKPLMRIVFPDSTIDYKIRYAPIPKRDGQKSN